MLGMPLIETKLFKEISLREETPEVKTSRGIRNARRNHRGRALAPERKWIPNRAKEGSGKPRRPVCDEAGGPHRFYRREVLGLL